MRNLEAKTDLILIDLPYHWLLLWFVGKDPQSLKRQEIIIHSLNYTKNASLGLVSGEILLYGNTYIFIKYIWSSRD